MTKFVCLCCRCESPDRNRQWSHVVGQEWTGERLVSICV